MSDPKEGSGGSHMTGIKERAADLDRARRDLQAAVDAARDHGLSWAAVGHALGVSRQAAWERFGRGKR